MSWREVEAGVQYDVLPGTTRSNLLLETHLQRQLLTLLQILEQQQYHQPIRRNVQLVGPIPKLHLDVRRSQVRLPRQLSTRMSLDVEPLKRLETACEDR
jgi:hypothetical protein